MNECLQNTAELSSDEQVNLKEMKRTYDRAVKIPAKFVAKKAKLSSEAYHAWVDARKQSDFASYAPFLKSHLAMAKEEAQFVGFSDAYDYAIDLHDPGLSADFIELLFVPLQKGILPILQQILDSPIKVDVGILKGFSVVDQEVFLKKVISKLGFDFNRGRIDSAVHPFCSGSLNDVRLTTRYDENNPLDSLFSSIHEAGHGIYEQGLPLSYKGTPMAEAVGMAVHESQSRIWENQVARSRGFWKYWEKELRKQFPQQLKSVASEDLYLAINAVGINPIRVDSDEVTYNLHIILRFTLEKALFAGDLKVEDLPHEWNRLTKELLGITPKNDAEGVLQDVHWSDGAFGYFPSYCLGNMFAAQLWETVNDRNPQLELEFSQGSFLSMFTWLRTNIHEEGKRLTTEALCEKATGKKLSPVALLKYLEQRYLPLYR